jgi:hypothetical protein
LQTYLEVVHEPVGALGHLVSNHHAAVPHKGIGRGPRLEEEGGREGRRDKEGNIRRTSNNIEKKPQIHSVNAKEVTGKMYVRGTKPSFSPLALES